MRTKLPERRPCVTTHVAWNYPGFQDQKLIVTFGFGDNRKVREVFCASFRGYSEICAMANDACILLSRLLQHGEDIANIAAALSENRQEGAASGPPASMIGAICRAAAEMQHGGTNNDGPTRAA